MLSLDIQVEIMKKLPVKSLIQFRSVCKEWKSLIDSSHFIAGYNNRHDLPHHLVVRYQVGYEENAIKYVSFVDDDTFPQQIFSVVVRPLLQVKATTVIGSSHGLLCLTGYHGETYETEEIAVIWNPAIRKSIAVVVPNNSNNNHNMIDDHPFSYVVGFGVCTDTKDPKLVKITYINNIMKMESISSIPCQVMVFTLSSGEWTCLFSSYLPRKSIQFTCSHTVIGQFIYWLAFDWISVDGEYRNLIMSFNMTTQEFREVDLPDSLANLRESDLSVSRLRESLAVVEYGDVFEDLTWKRVCSVWMMDHGDSKVFTKLFTINPPNASVSWTLGFRKSGEPIVEMQNDKDYYAPCALAVYEPCSEHIKDLGICGNRSSFFGSSYMESLLLLDHEDGRIVRCGAVKS